MNMMMQDPGMQDQGMMQDAGMLGAPLSIEEQNLLLRRQAQDALLQLRSNQVQEELGAIAKERQAEIAKEINSLDKDVKMPGKQKDRNQIDPQILSDLATMRINASNPAGY